jgi:anti-sigma B factor antagonist
MIQVQQEEPVCVVAIEAPRLDAARTPELRSALVSVAGGRSQLIIDLSKVDFIDSTALGGFISVLKALGSDGELALAGARPPVRRLLELTRLDQVMRLHPTLDEAKATFDA